ncbi:MAG: fatty acid desaturase [Proteobacteria bacterium]|nr:fatty acid desaturase [Pseudomonadota bacterium]
MKSYNVYGYAILALYVAAAAAWAPVELGTARAVAVAAAYFLSVWFLAGVYLSDVIHMGIAHGALDYRPWFIQALVLLNNTVGIYVNPVSWVNRHRNHHKFADHDGDPNKLGSDGFWKTTYLCLFPYRCQHDMARDEIFRSWPFVLVSHPAFAVLAQGISYGAAWLLVRDWKFALVLWLGIRVFALWVNLIQNYWTHDRRYGTRRYHDADNAMNIGDWLPVTATFSACWQNNHHHYPHLLRLSHSEAEFDFGYRTVKALSALGLVRPSKTGAARPPDLAGLPLGL